MAIGTLSPSPSSALEIKSTNRGLLIPRVSLLSTSDVATIPSPATSLLIYNLSTANDVTPGFYFWEGSWKTLKGSSTTTVSGGWGLLGNNSGDTDFLGTNNYKSLFFKVNGNQFAKFHPNGGMAIGNLSSANDNNSIAIGTSANAITSVDAIAFGNLSTGSGYQSIAIGKSSIASANSAVAVGFTANASGLNATAIGTNSVSSGQNATSIGYQATATQANSIILGSASNADNKIGIGTTTPTDRLHVVGSVKIVDGTQGLGKLLTSDANGKATWVAPSETKAYGDIYYSGSGQVLSQSEYVVFGTASTSSNITINSNSIQVTKAGKYRITYRITLSKSSGNSLSVSYNLYNSGTLMPGSLATSTVEQSKPVTISASVIANLSAYQQIQVKSNQANDGVSLVGNGCSLSLELID